MSADTWALTLVLHRTQRVADEAINRALDGILILAAFWFQIGELGGVAGAFAKAVRHLQADE